MNVLPVCIYVSTPHEYLVLLEVRGQVRFSGTKVTDGDEPPCGFWESKPGPLQKQQVFFTSEQAF